MLGRILLVLVIGYWSTAWAGVPFGARHVLMVDEETGKVLLEKNSAAVVPMASLTKILTAMVDLLEFP